MLQIIFDSETVKTFCTSSFDDVTIKTTYSDIKSGFVFDKARNTMSITYEKNYINKNIQDKLLDREKQFIYQLCEEKNITDCWITLLNGNAKKKNQYFEFHYNKDFFKKHSLLTYFNDNLKIIFSDKEINLEQFKKICQNKIFDFELKFMFYAIINTTKDKINIKIKLKITEIKILHLTDKNLNISHVKYLGNNTQNNYEYIYKYPTSKKKAVNNILQILQIEK